MERFQPLKNMYGHINVAGPCGYERKIMFKQTARFIEELNKGGEIVKVIRGPFTKPRTNGGNGVWYGSGHKSIPHALEVAARYGLIYATEVQSESDVLAVAQSMYEVGISKVVFWFGARNMSSGNIIDMANVIEDNTEEAYLIEKNFIFPDKSASEGIPGHIKKSRFPINRFILDYRGVSLKGLPPEIQQILNPEGYRNIYDFEWATTRWTGQWAKYNIPVLVDPSHIYGDDELVLKMAREYFNYPFSGHVLEVHPNPSNARSDSAQQLNFDQFAKWVGFYKEFFAKQQI